MPNILEFAFDETQIQTLWTGESPSHHEFRYAHPQSSLEFIVKVSRLGGKTVVLGLAVGDDKTNSFDVKTEDFTSANFFPWKRDERQSIVGGFIRESRMKDLAGLFKINILQKLIPGLNKSGYNEERQASPSIPNSSRPYQTLHDASNGSILPSHDIQPRGPEPANRPDYDPLRIPPRRPLEPEPMPDFEDPYDLNRPLPLFPPPSGGPFSIGHDDLNPPGLGDPFNFGRGGFGPTGLPRPGGGHGGMFMDIRGRGRGERPPGVPPGARWDPIGPGRRGRGGASNPFGGYMDDDFI